MRNTTRLFSFQCRGEEKWQNHPTVEVQYCSLVEMQSCQQQLEEVADTHVVGIERCVAPHKDKSGEREHRENHQQIVKQRYNRKFYILVHISGSQVLRFSGQKSIAMQTSNLLTSNLLTFLFENEGKDSKKKRKCQKIKGKTCHRQELN